MTTDLVPLDNMVALESLAPADREIAVTRMLGEARTWLAHAREATEPTAAADFKAFIATVAESTKQLNLSKEIQLDAQEMVRRAERGVGVAIREGQEQGTVARRGDIGVTGPKRSTRVGDLLRPLEVADVKHPSEISPIYAMTDGISAQDFDEALDEARSEGNLSRANVVRKIQSAPSHQTRQQRADIIRDLASQGIPSRNMTARVGVSEGSVRQIARDFRIDIPADSVIKRSRRLDSTDMVRRIVLDLETSANSVLPLIAWDTVDPASADDWLSSLKSSIRALNAFRNQIKELSQ